MDSAVLRCGPADRPQPAGMSGGRRILLRTPHVAAIVSAILGLSLASPAWAVVKASDFGFRPDNPVENLERGHQTAELQAAIDYCRTSGDHKLILDTPSGYTGPKEYTVSRVTYFPGLEIDGQGAILKKLKPSFAFDVIFESYERDDRNRRVAKIQRGVGRVTDSRGRVVTVQDIDRRAYVWRNKGLSPPTVFRNMTLIGDLEAFKDEEFNHYQREHSHGIVAAASDDNESRLNVLIDHCTFINHTGNGVYARDAKIVVRDCTGVDCFRGVISVTRNTDVLIERMESKGRWGGIDVEPENGPPGKVVVDGLTATHDLDVALNAGWTAELRHLDIQDGPVNFVVRDRGQLLVEDARLNSGAGQVELRTLGRDGTVTFRDVNFFGKNILWIQRGGWENVLRLEKAKNVGTIQQAQKPRDDANVLIRVD